MAERGLRRVDKVLVDGDGDSGPHSEGDDHPCSRDDGRVPTILLDDFHVDFQPDQEEEEDQANVGDEVEVRGRSGREDLGSESWYATKSRWTKEDAAYHFGNDFGLFDVTEGKTKTLGEDDDDDELDDEECDGLCGKVSARPRRT